MVFGMEKNEKDARAGWQMTIFCSYTVAFASMFVALVRPLLVYMDWAESGRAADAALVSDLLQYACMFVSAVLIAFVLRNVDRGRVFVKQNINLIRGFALTVEATGVALMGVMWWFDGSGQTYMFFLLTGIFVAIIGEAFNIGLRMREEQDLTV